MIKIPKPEVEKCEDFISITHNKYVVRWNSTIAFTRLYVVCFSIEENNFIKSFCEPPSVIGANKVTVSEWRAGVRNCFVELEKNIRFAGYVSSEEFADIKYDIAISDYFVIQ